MAHPYIVQEWTKLEKYLILMTVYFIKNEEINLLLCMYLQSFHKYTDLSNEEMFWFFFIIYMDIIYIILSLLNGVWS